MPPQSANAKVTGSNQVVVEWEAPKIGSPPVERYVINVTALKK